MSVHKHTPGPWRWEVNEKHKSVQLVGGVPKYDLTVMGFERWGMHDAAATLREPDVDGMNIMHRCTDWAKPVPGREHHADWFKAIDHPDALLIAAAPELLAALEAITELYDTDEGCRSLPEYKAARAAIAKATGGAA